MKKIPLPFIRFALGLGLVLTTASLASAQAVVPAPTLFYDFNSADDYTVKSTGTAAMDLNMYMFTAQTPDTAAYGNWLAGTGPSQAPGDRVLNLTQSTKMGGSGSNNGYGGGAVGGALTAFDGAKSLTLAGWFNAQSSIGNNASLINSHIGGASPGGFSLLSPSTGTLRLTVGGSTFDSNVGYGAAGSWVFFAVTFDNSGPGDAVVNFYIGGLDTPVTVVSTATGAASDITLGRNLTIGNVAKDAGILSTTRPFDGSLDNIGLWSSTEGGGGALTLEQLEGLRLQQIQIPEPASAAYLLGAFAVVFSCLKRRSVKS